MSLLDFGLSLVGVPDTTVKELHDRMPELQRIAAYVKELEPHITAALPIINKAMPDIVAVTPLVQALIAFAKQKENEK